MGIEWDHEGPYGRIRSCPKLTLAGRINGSIDGRPVTFVAERENLVFEVREWRTLLSARHGLRSIVKPLRAFFSRSDIRLLVRIRCLGSVEVLPNPAFLVRLILQ